MLKQARGNTNHLPPRHPELPFNSKARFLDKTKSQSKETSISLKALKGNDTKAKLEKWLGKDAPLLMSYKISGIIEAKNSFLIWSKVPSINKKLPSSSSVNEDCEDDSPVFPLKRSVSFYIKSPASEAEKFEEEEEEEEKEEEQLNYNSESEEYGDSIIDFNLSWSDLNPHRKGNLRHDSLDEKKDCQVKPKKVTFKEEKNAPDCPASPSFSDDSELLGADDFNEADELELSAMLGEAPAGQDFY